MGKAKDIIELSEEIWSGDVKTKWKPPEDLFSKGSAKNISDTLVSNSKDLKQAISRLNFYKNRAGANIDADRKKVLDSALDLIQKKFKKEKE
jgi:hypothetical protein